jgi:hypothetical protein
VAIAQQLQSDRALIVKRLTTNCKAIRLQGDKTAITWRLRSIFTALSKQFQSDCSDCAVIAQ